MSASLSKKSISVAAGSFLFALTSGTVLMFGIGGANAASTEACTVAKPVTSVTATGNNTITWNTSGNCEGVKVELYMVNVDGSETLIQTDSVVEDNQATFTYGVIASGTSYDFRISGSTENTATPVSLTKISQ